MCWSFDRAVQTFGNALESKLQLVARSSKKPKEAERRMDQVLDQWLYSGDEPGKQQKGRYRDPAALFK